MTSFFASHCTSFILQTLTRSANPLGKLMDFLQEDVDSMQRELETWRNENRELQSKLRYGSLLDNAPNCLSSYVLYPKEITTYLL